MREGLEGQRQQRVPRRAFGPTRNDKGQMRERAERRGLKPRPFKTGARTSRLLALTALLGAKIRAIEKLLQAKNLGFLLRRLRDQLEMLVDHRFSNLGKRTLGAERIAGLN